MINEGWCIEAICDRCSYTEFLAYCDKKSAKELLERRGWSVGTQVKCPHCREYAAKVARARERIERQNRGRKRWWK